MAKLFQNIKELVQVRGAEVDFLSGKEMQQLPTIKNAFLLIDDDIILDYGPMDNCPKGEQFEVIDLSGKMVLPTWCDSHTHLVFAGNREGEFVDRIKGLTYEQIAQKGGGILNSAKTLQQTSEDDLYEQSRVRLEEVIKLGTGAIEIKSGYGLTVESELKMLRVIRRLKENYPISIKSTFLGAHAIPTEYKGDSDAYINMLINELLPQISKEALADYIDVFCEQGYFTAEQTARILEAGQNYGLRGKIHVNQFHSIGGVEVGVQHHAQSVDHLEVMTQEDIDVLKNTETMPVALPGCSFFLSIPYTPAREMLNQGLPLALATDYNPGSAPSGNMNFVVSTACIKMNLTPEEAINAATINGAYAMGLEDTLGSITKGKLANFMITKPISSYGFIPYSYGDSQIDQVFIHGQQIVF